MAVVSKTTVKSYFNQGDKPTEGQFEDLIDSYLDHSDALHAVASAVAGGQTGFVIVEASADATLASAGAFGIQMVGAATTAAAQSLIATTIGADILAAADSTAAAVAIGITTAAQAVVFASTVTAMSSAVLSETGVVAAEYPNATITVDSAGRITAAVSGVGASAATTAAMEAGTVSDVFVSPAVHHRHQSSAKFWINFDGTNTATIREDYNITSITDNGTGDFSITIQNNFSNITYAVMAGNTGISTGATPQYQVSVETTASMSAGGFTILTFNTVDAALTDIPGIYLAGFGDQ